MISIIVPCYNQAQFLNECLQSVLEQTYENWECIIVNDGSPDHTEEVAKKWLEKDARFKYLYKENGGVSAARNFGIENAKGEWILPLDGDDKIGNQYLELARKEFDKGYSVIYCDAEFFGEINQVWNLSEYRYENLLIENQIFCSAFFTKSDWKKTSGYDSSLIYGLEDWDFWLSILNKNKTVHRLYYTGFFYRRKVESRDININKSKEKKDFSLNYIYKKHLNKYLSDNLNAIEYYNLQKRNNLNLNFYNEVVNKNFITKILFKLITKL